MRLGSLQIKRDPLKAGAGGKRGSSSLSEDDFKLKLFPQKLRKKLVKLPQTCLVKMVYHKALSRNKRVKRRDSNMTCIVELMIVCESTEGNNTIKYYNIGDKMRKSLTKKQQKAS